LRACRLCLPSPYRVVGDGGGIDSACGAISVPADAVDIAIVDVAGVTSDGYWIYCIRSPGTYGDVVDVDVVVDVVVVVVVDVLVDAPIEIGLSRVRTQFKLKTPPFEPNSM